MPFFSPKGEPLQNPYELLKLEHGVNDDEISKAFKKLMLQLHPDKQPVGQSDEEADAVARLMHDVMDAKAFLLDAEHMAARRQYDAMLVLKKQQPLPLAPRQTKVPIPSHQTKVPIPSHQTKVPVPSHQTKVPVAQHQHSTATGIPVYSTSRVRSDKVKEPHRDGGKHISTKSGVTPSTQPLNKNLNVKRWGKAKRSRATGRAEAKKQDLLKKTNPRVKEKAFNDSCGDCSTTDDTSDDELKRRHASNLNTSTANKQHSSKPSATKVWRPVPNPSDSKKSGGKCTSSVEPNRTKGRRDVQQAATKPKPVRSKSFERYVKSDRVIGNKTVEEDDINVRRETSRRSSVSPELVGNEHKPALASKSTDQPVHTENGTRNNHREVKYKSLRDAVDSFIEDLNSGLPSISVSQLDSSGMTSFLYTDFKFRLDVPSGISNNIIIQTWFEDNRKAFEISTLVAKFNASLQRTGVGGRLTFRKINGRYVFSLTKQVQPEQFCKNSFRHGIEYFVEMSIKLHNIINAADVRPLEKVRLTNSVAV
jgi:hypothetical protein